MARTPKREPGWLTDALLAADLPPVDASRKSLRWHFADMATMAIPAEAPEGTWDDYGTKQCWTDTDSMRGCPMPEALRLAREGWQEGAEQARALHAGIQATLPERRRLARYDVAGAVPNVARAISGNPLNMRRMVVKETNQRPVLTLICSIAVNWGFPAEAMMAHAAATAAAVDFLESGGFRCEVIVVARTGNSRIGAEIAVKLKTADQPLNLAVLAYGLGHPAMWRRLFFALLWIEKQAKPLGSGLGSAEPVRAMPELGTFTIAAASKFGHDADAPVRFRQIMRQLAQQGCPGIPEDMQDAA